MHTHAHMHPHPPQSTHGMLASSICVVFLIDRRFSVHLGPSPRMITLRNGCVCVFVCVCSICVWLCVCGGGLVCVPAAAYIYPGPAVHARIPQNLMPPPPAMTEKSNSCPRIPQNLVPPPPAMTEKNNSKVGPQRCMSWLLCCCCLCVGDKFVTRGTPPL